MCQVIAKRSGGAHATRTFPVEQPGSSLQFPTSELDCTPCSCTHSSLFLSFIFLFDFVDSMELEPTFLPVLMDFTLKSTENCPYIIAANLVPNLHDARQEVSLALLL